MDNLNVHVFDQTSSRPGKFKSLPKIIFLILGLVVLIEVILAAKTLIFSSQGVLPANNNQVVEAQKVPKISLSTTSNSVKVNDAVAVDLQINTTGHEVSGADVIIQFDPKFLEVGNLVKGNIFDQYPLLTADSKKGRISISGISDLKKGFTGQGLFATINLKAKVPGKTSLMINFKKGLTTQSNLVESTTSKNILEQVDNLEMNIQ